MNLLDRARGIVHRVTAGARPYRFEGEQENHADLLRERRVSLSMMAGAVAENPDQQRMASEIEHDAEARLTVLLGKPQLTLEEKRERDAIQTALQQRRVGFGDAPVLVAREGGWRPQRFLSAVAGVQLWHVLAVGWAVTFGTLAVQTARLENAKDDLRDSRADLAMSERNAADLASTNQRLAEEVNNANRDASASAANWRHERDIRVRAQREARSIRNEIDAARAGEPVDYGFGGVRDDGAPPPAAPSGDASSGGAGGM